MNISPRESYDIHGWTGSILISGFIPIFVFTGPPRERIGRGERFVDGDVYHAERFNTVLWYVFRRRTAIQPRSVTISPLSIDLHLH